MKLKVHGEEGDGGWEHLAGNQNTSVRGTGICLGGFVCKLSRRIRELETRDLLDLLYQKKSVFVLKNHDRYCRNKFNFCRLLKL